MEHNFSKYQSLGNDFILIEQKPLDLLAIQNICHRHLGIGADGVIFFEESSVADIKAIIFNNDGKQAAFCGNGLCCLAKYLHDQNKFSDRISIETENGISFATIRDKKVELRIVSIKHLCLGRNLEIDGGQKEFHSINTGVDHAIFFTEDIEKISHIGPEIRHHEIFAPDGTNVNFVKWDQDKAIARVYEKGLERRAFSCGSGALAVGIICGLILLEKPPIPVHFTNGIIDVDFVQNSGKIIEASITSEPKKVFMGSFSSNML